VKISNGSTNSPTKRSFLGNDGSRTPGPGTYKTGDLIGKNAPAISIKGKVNLSNRIDNPGPGAYDPAIQYSREKTPTYRMP
jgi:Sperm-tail PG-rich repeat